MVAAFPVAKLGVLLAKQLSKPIANFCKERAKQHPFFRKYICMPPAQFYNWCEVKMKMWILNLGKPVSVPVLNEASAIELGANLLGEGILFAIAAILLIGEYNRSARKEEKKEREKMEKEEDLQNTIHELYFATQKQATQINELTRMIYELQGGHHHHHHKSATVPPSEEEKVNSKKSDGKRPPSDGQPPILKKKPCKKHNNTPEITQDNFILKAVMAVEEDLFSSYHKEREPSLLTIAINHLYKDVYRLPLRI